MEQDKELYDLLYQAPINVGETYSEAIQMLVTKIQKLYMGRVCQNCEHGDLMPVDRDGPELGWSCSAGPGCTIAMAEAQSCIYFTKRT